MVQILKGTSKLSKTIEVYDRNNKRTEVHLVIDSYKYNGDTLTVYKDGDVLRTYLPHQFTGFKVNKLRTTP